MLFQASEHAQLVMDSVMRGDLGTSFVPPETVASHFIEVIAPAPLELAAAEPPSTAPPHVPLAAPPPDPFFRSSTEVSRQSVSDRAIRWLQEGVAMIKHGYMGTYNYHLSLSQDCSELTWSRTSKKEPKVHTFKFEQNGQNKVAVHHLGSTKVCQLSYSFLNWLTSVVGHPRGS